MAKYENENIGEIVEIIGPVIDIRFSDVLPSIYNMIKIEDEANKNTIYAEVEQHIGDDKEE